jgi:outer membrane lipoprotein SlyB
LIAEVTATPGERSVDADEEGDIESRKDKGARQAEAAAAGAAIGAAAGAAAHGGKGAAIGAAVGAAGGFVATSGYGQELTLEKNTKLELTLDRPLYLGRS